MGVPFLVAALIPIAPYFLLNGSTAIWCSILFTLISLLILGLIKGYLVKKNVLKSGAEVFLVGMGSACIGYILGESIPVVLSNIVR